MKAPSYTRKEDFIPDSVDLVLLARDPSFVDYLFFHNVLDKFCWVAKLHYADRETVKRKRYRLDTLFQRCLLANKVRREKARKCLCSTPHENRLEFHITKGWHNELVRSDPLLPDYLEIGTQLTGWKGPGSGGMIAWNVIQSYYAAFEFYSCVAVATDAGLEIEGHKQLSSRFNNHVLGKACDRLVFYPFSLSSATPRARFPPHPQHCQYHYASYPREMGRGVAEIEIEVQKALQFLGKGQKSSLLDVLYAFRLWANYTGVQGLIKLADGGYQGFLMKNLGMIVFFIAGMAELAVLFSLGESTYLRMLKEFSTPFIDMNERFARNKYLIPPYIRLRAYKHLGIIHGDTRFIIPEPPDPVQLIEMGPVAEKNQGKPRNQDAHNVP